MSSEAISQEIASELISSLLPAGRPNVQGPALTPVAAVGVGLYRCHRPTRLPT